MKFKHPGQWYSPAWLLSGNVEPQAINAEYRYLRTKVRQRLDRLIKSTNGRYADTQFVREAQAILEIGGRGPRAKALSLSAFHDWLSRKTTATDIKKIDKETQNWLSAWGYDVPMEQVAELWSFLDWYYDQNTSYTVSPKLIELYVESKKWGVHLEDIKNDVNWWLSNYQYMPQLPVREGRREYGSEYYRKAVNRIKSRRKS